MRRILLAAVLVAVAAPAPSGGVHRASCRPTAVWRGWSMGSGSSSPTTTGASPIGAWGVGQLRARLAGRSGGVGAASAGGDTGSGAAGRRRRPARPRTARQGVVTMTADSRQLGADAHREGVRVQQEHGEALRGGFDEPVLMRCRGE